MPGQLQPLDQKFAIVGPDGRPTDYFIRWAQQKQIDIEGAITADQAIALIVQYLDEHRLQEGSGIQITPSGNLTDMPTIAADVQEILDQISSTRGTIIYRGLLGWAALAPGTSGQFLKTNGAGADPSWATASGGGSAAWTLIDQTGAAAAGSTTWTFSTNVTNVDVTGLAAWNEILLYADAITATSSGFRTILASVDNGTNFFNTSGNYVRLPGDGSTSNAAALMGHSAASAAARTIAGHIKNLKGVRNLAVNNNGSTQDVIFVASASDINALRMTTSAGQISGGNLYVYAR